jgi:hypothetical protein
VTASLEVFDWRDTAQSEYVTILGYLWLVGGFTPSEKYEFVSWDYSQYMESQKTHVPNQQPNGKAYQED